jgi:hypothetical protein
MKKRRCSCSTCIFSVELLSNFWCQRYPDALPIPDAEICGEGVFVEDGYPAASLREIYQGTREKKSRKKGASK